jgi:hypothetical protein
MQGVAWVDYPTATDQAHGLAECSNKVRSSVRSYFQQRTFIPTSLLNCPPPDNRGRAIGVSKFRNFCIVPTGSLKHDGFAYFLVRRIKKKSIGAVFVR